MSFIEHDYITPGLRARLIGFLGYVLCKTVWVDGAPLGRHRQKSRGVGGDASSSDF